MLFRRAPAESRARRGLYRARTAPPNDATNGLLLETSTGTIALDKVRAVATAKDAGPADLVVFEVKNYGVPQTAEILAASLNPEALILTVQNGITAQPLLAETFGKDRILPGVVRKRFSMLSSKARLEPVSQTTSGERSGRSSSPFRPSQR
jgi:ketopantoate reductase